MSGSGISWAICKSEPRSRQITTPAPHHSVFLQAGCPSCRPTNSVKGLKALKAESRQNTIYQLQQTLCSQKRYSMNHTFRVKGTEGPIFHGLGSYSMALSHVWLLLPEGRFQSCESQQQLHGDGLHQECATVCDLAKEPLSPAQHTVK